MEKLINFRKSLKLSQKKFGDLLGASQSMIYQVETGRRPIPPDMAAKIINLSDGLLFASDLVDPSKERIVLGLLSLDQAA